MNTEQQVQVYTFSLNIQSVKMKMKFACKMKLEHNGIFTSEVSQNEADKFIFNQEFTLQEDSDRSHFQIIAHLSTEKGAKYIAGVIKLAQKQLVHQEGEMLIVPLSRCLDNDACCQLRVDQVSSEKVMKKIAFDKLITHRYREANLNFSPTKQSSSGKPVKGTRSQYQFPHVTNKKKDWDESKGKDESHSILNRPLGVTFRKKNIQASQLQRQYTQFTPQINPDRVVQAEVYKQSYHKLKQKYKKQAQTAKQQVYKRLALQNSQNNYKLQIMRLKMRCQEQQKSINQKNSRIKQFQVQLAGLQKKQLDIEYLKEQNDNKDHKIRMMEETIKALNRDNQDLKNLNKQRFQGEQQKIRQIRKQLQTTKNKCEEKVLELSKQIREKSQIILQKDSDLKLKNQRIEKQQKIISDMQKNAQNKIIEFERILQSQKQVHRGKMEDMKELLHKLENQKKKLQEKIQQDRIQNEKVKTFIVKMQYERKISNQEIDAFKIQTSQLKITKDKYHQLTREHRLLEQDKNHLQKLYDKAILSKDTNISDLTKQFQQQIDHYKRIYKQVDDKLKNILTKNLQLESANQQRRNQIQKNKRINESLNRQLLQLKQKQKKITKQCRQQQQLLSKYSINLDGMNNKFKNDYEVSQIQLQNIKEQYSKLKKQYESKDNKHNQLLQINGNLNIEVNKLKLKIQNVEDQGEKNKELYKEKIDASNNANKELERKNQDCSHLISNLKQQIKGYQDKLQNMDINALQTNQKIEKFAKQKRNTQEKIALLQKNINKKSQQILKLQSNQEILQNNICQLEDKLSMQKNSVNLMKGENNKNDKIMQLLNKQINQLKGENQRNVHKIHEKQKSQQKLRMEIKRGKQQLLKTQIKLNSTKKQYEKFRQNISETLNITFSQIPFIRQFQPLTDDKKNLNNKTNNNEKSSTLQQFTTLNSQILLKISNQNKQVKSTMNKITQQNKNLKKQLQQLNEKFSFNLAKYQSTQSQLNEQIQNLQDELQKMYILKQQQSLNLSKDIGNLTQQVKCQKQRMHELQQRIQQQNFTINSLKMQEEGNKQHFNFKHKQYESNMQQLEQKVNYLESCLAENQRKCHELDLSKSQILVKLSVEMENIVKKDKIIEELHSENNTLNHTNQEGKRFRKQLMERISELELKFNTEVQLSEKVKQHLSEQQHKGSQLKQFVSNLMKQKQIAIKSQLDKCEQIITLEGQLIEIKRQRDMNEEECVRLKKIIQDIKEVNKKNLNHIKQIEQMQSENKAKLLKISQKLKQTQRELKESQQIIEKMQQEKYEYTEKSNKQMQKLKEQLQNIVKVKYNDVKQFEEKTNQLSDEVKNLLNTITCHKKQISVLEEKLFIEKQNSQLKMSQNQQLMDSLQQIKKDLKKKNQLISQNNEQLKQKQESMFDMSGKIFQLELKIENQEKQKITKIDDLNYDWNAKYECVCEQYEQRLELFERQKNHLSERLQEKEEYLKKKIDQLRTSEINDVNLKKVLEEKVRKLEEDRLVLISSKNAEIQKFSEENKNTFEKLKIKEGDLRRIYHQLEIARNTINKLELLRKQNDQKTRQLQRTHLLQLEQLRKKQAVNRMAKQQLGRVQWDIERDLKKSITIYCNKLISGQQKQATQKIIGEMKNMEEQVLMIISQKLSVNARSS